MFVYIAGLNNSGKEDNTNSQGKSTKICHNEKCSLVYSYWVIKSPKKIGNLTQSNSVERLTCDHNGADFSVFEWPSHYVYFQPAAVLSASDNPQVCYSWHINFIYARRQQLKILIVRFEFVSYFSVRKSGLLSSYSGSCVLIELAINFCAVRLWLPFLRHIIPWGTNLPKTYQKENLDFAITLHDQKS